jgi:hypothetical protein
MLNSASDPSSEYPTVVGPLIVPGFVAKRATPALA